jgi:hypothetical protein
LSRLIFELVGFGVGLIAAGFIFFGTLDFILFRIDDFRRLLARIRFDRAFLAPRLARLFNFCN